MIPSGGGFIFMEMSNLTNKIDSSRIVGKKGSIDQKENICFDLLLFLSVRFVISVNVNLEEIITPYESCNMIFQFTDI